MFRLKALLLIVMIAVSFNACKRETRSLETKSENTFGWRSVYKHDASGKAINGSIDSLISGIRKGFNVRVGWGWKKIIGDSLVIIEHVATPVFLTIIQEKNVSVVIDPHPLLQSYIDVNNQSINSVGELWQCVITTEGKFNAQVYDRATGQLIKNWPQRHLMTWFLEYNNHGFKNTETLYNRSIYPKKDNINGLTYESIH